MPTRFSWSLPDERAPEGPGLGGPAPSRPLRLALAVNDAHVEAALARQPWARVLAIVRSTAALSAACTAGMDGWVVGLRLPGDDLPACLAARPAGLAAVVLAGRIGAEDLGLLARCEATGARVMLGARIRAAAVLRGLM